MRCDEKSWKGSATGKQLSVKIALIYLATVLIWFFGRNNNNSRVNSLYVLAFVALGLVLFGMFFNRVSALERKTRLGALVTALALLLFAVILLIVFAQQISPSVADSAVYNWQSWIGLAQVFGFVTALGLYGYFEPNPKQRNRKGENLENNEVVLRTN